MPASGKSARLLESLETTSEEQLDTSDLVAARPTLRARIRAHWQEWWALYVAFALSRVVVFAVGFGSEIYMRVTGANPDNWRPFAFAETYPHYADVAANGYNLQNAFDYPLLPGLMALFGTIGIPFAVTAMVLTNVCLLLGLFGFVLIGERYVGRDAALRGAAYLAFAPFAYWFSIASTESLMLALAMGSVLFALRATPASWLLAGALAAPAALTRPPGALLGLVLLAIAVGQLAQKRLKWRGVLAALTAGAAIPAAIFSFFGYLKVETGDAFAALHAQDQFNREVTLDGPIKAFNSAITNTLAGSVGQAIELVATLGSAALIVWFFANAAGARSEIRGWSLFAFVSLLMPIATGVLWQMPRFALLIPPVFWMLGKLGERRAVHYPLLVGFALALGIKVVTAVVGVEG